MFQSAPGNCREGEIFLRATFDTGPDTLHCSGNLGKGQSTYSWSLKFWKLIQSNMHWEASLFAVAKFNEGPTSLTQFPFSLSCSHPLYRSTRDLSKALRITTALFRMCLQQIFTLYHSFPFSNIYFCKSFPLLTVHILHVWSSVSLLLLFILCISFKSDISQGWKRANCISWIYLQDRL